MPGFELTAFRLEVEYFTRYTNTQHQPHCFKCKSGNILVFDLKDFSSYRIKIFGRY